MHGPVQWRKATPKTNSIKTRKIHKCIFEIYLQKNESILSQHTIWKSIFGIIITVVTCLDIENAYKINGCFYAFKY